MQDIDQIVHDCRYASGLQDVVNQHPADVVAQVEAAFEALPAALADDEPETRAQAVEAWFAEQFHAEPVSLHTPLFNRLHAEYQALQARLATL